MGPGVTPPVRLYLGLVAFSLAGSGFSRATGLDPGPIAPVTAALTLGVGLWASLGSWLTERTSRWGWLAGIALFGAGSEIVGVLTGYPFGQYVYTDRWWPTVPLSADSRFPLLLPFAWLLIAGSSWMASPGSGWRRVLFGALLATLVDIVMEPTMAGPLGYWRWLEKGPLPGGAPLMNAVGWLVVSLSACAALEISSRNRSLPHNPQPTTHNPQASARWVLAGQTALTLGLGLLLRG
ncbi:carotenoid biosynthesis protein [bacterium]|nr:MAG: carotenoid biosynthesis protein [bacterium]